MRKKGSGYSKVMGYWAPKHILEAIFVERDRSAADRECKEGKVRHPAPGERHASETMRSFICAETTQACPQ